MLSSSHATPPPPAPTAAGKWVTASVATDAAEVVARVFEEAERRDPGHQPRWVALVDGNNHQIDRINHEATSRNLKVSIVIDLIHVMEYIWAAAWCFFAEGDTAAETWVQATGSALQGDLDKYWDWHLDHELQRTHRSRYEDGVIPLAA